MSVLAHLCRRCPHPSEWHEARNRGYTACPCCRAGECDADPEPTLLPTVTSPGGRPEPLWWPGEGRNVGTMHASTPCDCAACHHAASRLSAEATSGERGVEGDGAGGKPIGVRRGRAGRMAELSGR